MKVLHICSYYIGSKLYSNLISTLDELGIYNDLFIPVNSNELINKNYKEGLNKTNFIYSKNFGKLDRFNFKLKTSKIYQDLLNKVSLDSIDIVHAHSLFVNGYVAYKLKKDKNIDYIVAVRNTDINVFFKYMPWMRNLGIEIIKNAKKVIFISNTYKEYMLDEYLTENNKFKNTFEVIPNGVDKFWLDNMNYEKVESKEKNIVYVGSIDKNKNIISTIKAIDKLRKKGYEINFDIVGTGKYEDKIIKLQSKNREYIKIHGQVFKEKLIDIYSKSDIFVMPSRYETFGLVYVEALTQGTPIIYTRGQGFDGYFEDGDVGFSVDCNDINEIADKIEFILNNEMNIEKFKNNINKRFNWKSIAQKYIDIYDS